MGQRINIQYSVELDDLADEVRRLMKEAHSRYVGLWEIQDQTVELTNETLEKVDQIRQELIGVDHRLNDVANIISGYLYYKAQEMNPTPVPSSSLPPDTGLEARLEEFKSLIQGDENEVSHQGK